MSRVLIQFSNLHKSFGSNLIFNSVSLSIHSGEIFALVGENGAGKSILLKILSGSEVVDSGSINHSSASRTNLFSQEELIGLSEETAGSYLEDNRLVWLDEQMALCVENPDRLEEWSKLHEEYEQMGGYKKVPIEAVINGLKLSEELLELPIIHLSGGQWARIRLAKVLLDNPDLLLLDEPTNHLDSEMLEWLIETLQSREGATVIVSHDRGFINTTCNRLLEISNGMLNYYAGNYDFYLEEKSRLLEREKRGYEEQKEKKAAIKEKLKKLTFSKKKTKGPKDRNLMAYDKRGEKHQKSNQRTLDQLKAELKDIEDCLLSKPKSKTITGIKFTKRSLLSTVALELRGARKSYGEKVLFSAVDLQICKGERILLSGPNGSGKSTLLQCLAGVLSLDQGVLHKAPTAKVAYLDQKVARLPMERTPLSFFEESYSLSEEELRSELHKAALGSKEKLFRPFYTLSIGERKRFMLLALILDKPNVLLLDEPTNHLDLLTIEALENALLKFEGAIIVVSHDRTFTEKIATKRLQLRPYTKNIDVV